MDHIGMDIHKKDSQLCILTEAGAIEERPNQGHGILIIATADEVPGEERSGERTGRKEASESLRLRLWCFPRPCPAARKRAL